MRYLRATLPRVVAQSPTDALMLIVNDATRTRDLDDASTVLAREAGVPFRPPLGEASGVGPFAEWLGLMEVI